jgi:hypothetical protein
MAKSWEQFGTGRLRILSILLENLPQSADR